MEPSTPSSEASTPLTPEQEAVVQEALRSFEILRGKPLVSKALQDRVSYEPQPIPPDVWEGEDEPLI